MTIPRLRLVLPGERAGQEDSRPAYDVAAAAAMGQEPASTGHEPATTGQEPASRQLATSPPLASGSRPATTTAPATSQPPAAPATGATAGPATTPVIEPFGRPMTADERAGRVVRHWARSARQGAAAAACHPWQALCAVPVFVRLAADVAGTRAYIRSGAWVPDGHEGSLLPWLGRAYHYGPGALLKAAAWLLIGAGEGLRFTADRPMRAGIALVLAAGCWAGLLAGHLL